MLIWLFKCILTKLIWIANRAFIQLFSLFKDSICYSWLILLTFSPLFPVDILIWFGFVVAAELLFWDGVFRNWHANPKEIISNPHEIISWVWYLGWPASGALQSHVLSSILPPTSAASSFHPGSILKKVLTAEFQTGKYRINIVCLRIFNVSTLIMKWLIISCFWFHDIH